MKIVGGAATSDAPSALARVSFLGARPVDAHVVRIVHYVIVLAAFVIGLSGNPTAAPPRLHFIFTSDQHYGLTRASFRGQTGVPASAVNHALVAEINALSAVVLPKDGGLGEGEALGPVAFVAVGGDIANRAEIGAETTIQPASTSWAQFEADYLRGIRMRTAQGLPTPVYVVPGNHDATNAVGWYRPMAPARDPSSMIAIYNLMMRPAIPMTAAAFDYRRDAVLTSRDLEGLHLEFLQVWPDSRNRAWIERDLRDVSSDTPVIMFAHDQPEGEAKHFVNPNGEHGLTENDRFENLLADTLQDGTTIEAAPLAEDEAFEHLLAAHPNLTAYFHGNSNWNQFYDWTGPHHSVTLHTFRVDSPMKGAVSATDETRLSFQLVTVDPVARVLTVRECLWNAHPDRVGAPGWGGSTTVALWPRPRIVVPSTAGPAGRGRDR